MIRAENDITLVRVDDGAAGPRGPQGESGEDATTLRIDSSRGTVFKNSEVNTVLSVVIYKGSKRITDSAALMEEFGAGAYLQWYFQKMDESEYILISAGDERLRDKGFSFLLSPEDVDTKCVFMCELIT